MSQILTGDSRLMQIITRYLENLRQTVDGDELHGIISRTLRRHSRHGSPGPDCLLDLYSQLDAYARDPVSLSSMRIRARLLQQHIAPYISELKIAPLEEPAAPASETPVRSESVVEVAPTPPTETTTPAPSPNESPAAIEGVLERPAEKKKATSQARAEKYQQLLRSENDAWQAIYGTVKDYQRLKDAWLKSLDELARQRAALEDRLVKTTEQLSKLEVENDQLRNQLQSARNETAKRGRVHAVPKLLRAGGRAGSTKRDAFLKSLEAEIKRIKRSGAPLALGLIKVESLDALIARHGADAAAAALRCSAEEVLSNFRAYDLVASYDQDVFAILFPDTSKDGARRALEKAFKRAVESHVTCSGGSIPLPPFAGALVMYSAGEEPAAFLGRAGEALAKLCKSGTRGVVSS
ncbi:MAG: diguanylate cyclase domain-containing protein [Sulfurifustaceae bacterium]